MQALQQQQQQQQIEEVCCLLVAFECRRCFASFASNTKLHQHIRDRHAKRLKTSTSISTPTPKPFAISFSPKLFAVSTTILTSSSSYSCLANHVTRPISAVTPSSKSSAAFTSTHTPPPSYSSLINHVTRFTNIIPYRTRPLQHVSSEIQIFKSFCYDYTTIFCFAFRHALRRALTSNTHHLILQAN